MYARSTTIKAQPWSIDDGIAHIRYDVMPAMQRVEGCVGVSLLVDRRSGRCIATSSWENDDAMYNSAEWVQPIRDRAARVFGGIATVEEWDIAVLHRDHRSQAGSCVRATWVRVPPARMTPGIEYYKNSILPQLENLDGFCSASLLVNRLSGRAVSATTFDSVETMQRSRSQATELKTRALQEVGAEGLDEGEFELALAHLRVPELV